MYQLPFVSFVAPDRFMILVASCPGCICVHLQLDSSEQAFSFSPWDPFHMATYGGVGRGPRVGICGSWWSWVFLSCDRLAISGTYSFSYLSATNCRFLSLSADFLSDLSIFLLVPLKFCFVSLLISCELFT